jgi:hypothetical protein
MGMTGCHRSQAGSQFIQASIENVSPEKLSVVEMDYPNAGFGVSTLAPGARYSYRFKPQGSGALQLSYTDGSGKAHAANGPVVREDQGGALTVRIGGSGAPAWSTTR